VECPLARSAFSRAAGAAAEGVIVPFLTTHGTEGDAVARAYEARWQENPDDAALYGYDAVRLVAAALRRSGLNRARVRDAVRALVPWPGASGLVAWNATGRNEGPVSLGIWRDGRLIRELVHSPDGGRRTGRAGRRSPARQTYSMLRHVEVLLPLTARATAA